MLHAGDRPETDGLIDAGTDLTEVAAGSDQCAPLHSPRCWVTFCSRATADSHIRRTHCIWCDPWTDTALAIG